MLPAWLCWFLQQYRCDLIQHDSVHEQCTLITLGTVSVCLYGCGTNELWKSNEAIVVQWLVWSTSWDFKVVKRWWAGALLSVKWHKNHCERVVLAHLKKKNKLAAWWLSGSVLSQFFIAPLGIVIAVYYVNCFCIFQNFLYCHNYIVHLYYPCI